MASKAKGGSGAPTTKPGHNGRHPDTGKASGAPRQTITRKV